MFGFAVFDVSGLIKPFELNIFSFIGFVAMSFSGTAFVIISIIEAIREPIRNGGMLFATAASSFGGLMMLWVFTISTIIIVQKFFGWSIFISPWLGLAAFLSVIFCCIYMPMRNYIICIKRSKDE